MDRDLNAARNILRRGLGTAGHVGTFGLEPSNAVLRIDLYCCWRNPDKSKLNRRLKNPRAFTLGSVNCFLAYKPLSTLEPVP
jgi:transposase